MRTTKIRALICTTLLAFFVTPTLFVSLAHSQTVTALYNFTNQNGSGFPQDVALVQGRDSNLYGMSYGSPDGSIFKLSTSRVFTNLFAFNFTDGCCPGQGLTLATDGNFYGATVGGGSGNDQDGVFFKITPGGIYTVIHNFAGSTDGSHPFAPPVEALDGNLYGTAQSAVYKYVPSSGNFSTIYQFSSGVVDAPLIQASDGFLYGTTANGGWDLCGTVFKMSTAGVLLQSVPFLCNAAGAGPSGGPLLQVSDGNFYGTTSQGGIRNGGTVFKMTPDLKISILYSFMGKSPGTRDGFTPAAGLIQATDGNLYGATFGGGANGMGALYRISTAGEYQLIYSFDGSAGKAPQGTLMQHTNGILYGTAQVGGANQDGTVYQINLGFSPFITFVQHTGAAGQTAQILGQKLTGATSVTFNGVPATSFTVSSPTFLLATVPSGATTGPVVVTTPTATLTTNVNFNLAQ